MSYWIDIFNVFISGVALLLSMMALWLTAMIPGIGRWSRRFFISYFIVFILCCLTGLAELPFQYYLFPQRAMYYLLLVESLLLSLPLPMMTVFLVHCYRGSIRSDKLFRAVFVLWAVFFLVLVISFFIGDYSVTPDNHYTRASLYPLEILPLIAILFLNLAGAIRHRAQLSRRIFRGFIIGIVPLMAALFVQLFVDFYPIINSGYVISAMAMYGFIVSDQIEQSLRQQRDNARLQTEIMLSQIQPHFLNNTLVAIGHLCSGAPEAKAALYKFAGYLQGNMDALTRTDPIPFTTELEHTKAFLELEQLRFGKKLNVVYDLEATAFLLPTLTLQPIAENAVEHGVRENEDGAGTVKISTREYPERWEITVSDDGPGFDPGAVATDGERHIGLRNVRERLRHVCGGGLRIESEPGKGCHVMIELPKETGGKDADIRH